MRQDNQLGVTMVEMALILPAILIMCFGVVDLLRISYFESMLQRAAADIAIAARTSPNLDYDLRDLTQSSGEYYDYKDGRANALISGLQFAMNSFTDAGIPSDAELIQATQVDDALGNYTSPMSPATQLVSTVAILRPGEQATFSYVDQYGNTIVDILKHPIIPSDINGKLPAQRMENLLGLAPIHVELRARVKPLLWVLGTRTVKGVATTYREEGIRRVIAYDASGNEIAPTTATRKNNRTPEIWGLPVPEPVDPTVVCGPAPGPGTLMARWARHWKSAFQQNTIYNTPWIVDTTSNLLTCPLVPLSQMPTSMGL